ncbi:MAG: DUF2127 domain-containing protein [Terracidiphilus sp.]|jgi:uncharacterized membrane protein (DUF2068 family)
MRFPSFFARSSGHRHNRLLVLIALYKFLHALVYIAIGVGALHLLHKDVADQIDLLARHFRFDPESRLVNFLLDKASLLNDPVLRRIGFVAYSYAAITMAEAIGLYLEQAWAEYLTLVITGSFLPWELFEVFRRITWFRVSLFTINLLVFAYLLRIVLERARHRAKSRQKSSP